MSTKTLQILARIAKNTTPATTANNPENPMNEYLTPFPTAWLAPTETAAILTVTRKGSIVQYLNCTDGAQYIDAPVPEERSFMAGTRMTEVRNTRDHDYITRLLALNGQLEVGDIIEVKSSTGYMPVERVEITDLDFPSYWRYCGVKQPIENILVSIGFRRCRYYGEVGGWSDRFTGKTDPVTGIVEPDLSRW